MIESAALQAQIKFYAARWGAAPLTLFGLAASTLLAVASTLFALWAFLAPEVVEAAAAVDWRAPVFDGKAAAHAAFGDDSQTLTRPIFVKTRRPAAPSATAAPVVGEPAAPATGVVVSAIVAAKGARRAFLATPSNPDGAWLSVGDSFAGWTVAKIESTRVEVKNGAQSAQLQLYSQQEAVDR
jgi:hypothetical protein